MIEGWYSEEKLTAGHSLWEVNPFTPTGDQDRISPYNIKYNIKQAGNENREEYQLWDY